MKNNKLWLKKIQIKIQIGKYVLLIKLIKKINPI